MPRYPIVLLAEQGGWRWSIRLPNGRTMVGEAQDETAAGKSAAFAKDLLEAFGRLRERRF